MLNEEIGLSPLGQAQAARLATDLLIEPAAVLISQFLRTRQTACHYCQRHMVMPVEHPLLHEFRTLDPALIAGLNQEQRRPIVDRYWSESNPDEQMGEDAESFHAFAGRVARFHAQMNDLPDQTVIFTHGMWLAMLVWQSLGLSAQGSISMRNFRRFVLGLPMPNCALYHAERTASGYWYLHMDEGFSNRMAVV